MDTIITGDIDFEELDEGGLTWGGLEPQDHLHYLALCQKNQLDDFNERV